MKHENASRAIRRSAAMSLIAGGVFAAAQSVRAQSALPVVRIGALAIDAAGEAYYGDQAGIFVANGINPQVTTLTSGAAITQAVLAGDLDAGFSNPLQIAAAIARNIPLQMIVPAALYSKRDASENIFVAKDAPYKSPKDLSGT